MNCIRAENVKYGTQMNTTIITHGSMRTKGGRVWLRKEGEAGYGRRGRLVTEGGGGWLRKEGEAGYGGRGRLVTEGGGGWLRKEGLENEGRFV